MEIKNLGTEAVLLQWESKIDPIINQEVHHLNEAILEQKIPGVQYTIPAYASLCIGFDQNKISKSTLVKLILQIHTQLTSISTSFSSKIKIPVCYQPNFGIDLKELSQKLKLSVEEIIKLHYEKTYQVYMLGFMMGFPYLGSLNPKIQIPRKAKPRKLVTEGSIGIAGSQTGIYPSSAPSGWQIIGQSPVKIFDIHKTFPFEIEAGDQIQFYPISESKFHEIQNDQKEGKYELEYEK